MTTALTFRDVAKNIIKETISSAIFIDDKALENFKSKNSKNRDDNKRTIELFQDFRKNQCLLHSFKYTKKGWKDNKRFYLKNKDLLILDWQLVRDEHYEALRILNEAVSEKSLHFICIYTKENQDAVKNEINRFFLGNISEENKATIRELLSGSKLDDYWTIEKTHQDWEELDTSINSIINAKIEDIDSEIENLRAFYDLTPEIIESIKSINSSNIISSFAKLKTALSKDISDFSNHSELSFFKKSVDDDNTFYIGHTIVKIFKKDTVSGDQLYDSFLVSFLKEKNIFLSLMGLEMRNRFRENSAFIGKDFDDLNEDAFFYHKKNNGEHPYIFFDFLRDILKDQVASFMYEKNLTLFDVLEEYFKSINGSKRISEFEAGGNPNFKKDVFKLNYFYNRININHRLTNDFLRFGDVFKADFPALDKDKNPILIERFFICITPHCDCLRSNEKIKNQFWFVEGKKEDSQESVLKKTDGKFISFIKEVNSNDVIAINWEIKEFCQPFTMLVANNKFTEKLNVSYYGTNVELTFIDSIKENYTQRIANEAFGYPMRVGIDFVKK
ncbi:MAG TPA: response regulator receiver domain [Leadbetterella sp.]|nr:response regulator receiver domain [Leadbetterella sp.]